MNRGGKKNPRSVISRAQTTGPPVPVRSSSNSRARPPSAQDDRSVNSKQSISNSVTSQKTAASGGSQQTNTSAARSTNNRSARHRSRTPPTHGASRQHSNSPSPGHHPPSSPPKYTSGNSPSPASRAPAKKLVGPNTYERGGGNMSPGSSSMKSSSKMGSGDSFDSSRVNTSASNAMNVKLPGVVTTTLSASSPTLDEDLSDGEYDVISVGSRKKGSSRPRSVHSHEGDDQSLMNDAVSVSSAHSGRGSVGSRTTRSRARTKSRNDSDLADMVC